MKLSLVELCREWQNQFYPVLVIGKWCTEKVDLFYRVHAVQWADTPKISSEEDKLVLVLLLVDISFYKSRVWVEKFISKLWITAIREAVSQKAVSEFCFWKSYARIYGHHRWVPDLLFYWIKKFVQVKDK